MVKPGVRHHGDGSLDEDSSLLQPSLQVEIQKQEEMMNRRAFSFLSGSQVRWMSKRKPNASNSAKTYIPPSRVLQLRSIFKGLDFDGSGEISLQELKDAVSYVAASKTGTGPPLIKDPVGISKLFESMDIDGNGVVDFEEFLLGMTANSADGDASAVKDVAGMQQAFYEFANQHRRQMIIDKMKDESVPVTERYDEFRKLYAIKFIKEDASGGVSTEDLIKQAKRDAAQEKGEMASASRVIRQREIARSRAAGINFHEKMAVLHPHKDGPYPAALKGYIGSTVPPLLNKGAGVYRSQFKLGSSKSMEAFKRETLERSIAGCVSRQVAGSMAKFPLPVESTHMPPLALSRSTSQLAMAASREAAQVRAGMADLRRDVLQAPVGMRQQIVDRALASKVDFDRESHHHHHHHHHRSGHHGH